MTRSSPLSHAQAQYARAHQRVLVRFLPRPGYRWSWTDPQPELPERILHGLKQKSMIRRDEHGRWFVPDEIAEVIFTRYGDHVIDGDPGQACGVPVRFELIDWPDPSREVEPVGETRQLKLSDVLA